MLFLDDGRLEVFAKLRTKRRAIRLILEQMAEEAGDPSIHTAVFHDAAVQEAEELRRSVAERFGCVELLTTEFTPVMGA